MQETAQQQQATAGTVTHQQQTQPAGDPAEVAAAEPSFVGALMRSVKDQSEDIDIVEGRGPIRTKGFTTRGSKSMGDTSWEETWNGKGFGASGA